MEFVVVTGMSGAGKSKAADALEDIGYYCVDNMPPVLLPKFAELCLQAKEDVSRVALVADVRSRDSFGDLWESLERLKESQVVFKLLFLDCEEGVLAHRFKETRRQHPLYDRAGGSTERAIAMERKLLEQVRYHADYLVDTTHLSTGQLKERISQMFLNTVSESLLVECMSFGFKFGAPAEADMLFDVRCFPNPFYEPDLKNKTGMDREVQDYVHRWEDVQTFEEKLQDMLRFLLPLYCKEGKSQVVLAIGCTGGKHRSVTIARDMAAYVESLGYRVQCSHRDIQR